MTGPGRPERSFDPGLQQERTSLAWERTSMAMMVAGVLLARYAAQDAHPGIAVFGIGQTVVGAAMLVWAGLHYEDLHDQLRSGTDITHPRATQLVGLATIAFTVVALVLSLTVALAS